MRVVNFWVWVTLNMTGFNVWIGKICQGFRSSASPSLPPVFLGNCCLQTPARSGDQSFVEFSNCDIDIYNKLIVGAFNFQNEPWDVLSKLCLFHVLGKFIQNAENVKSFNQRRLEFKLCPKTLLRQIYVLYPWFVWFVNLPKI